MKKYILIAVLFSASFASFDSVGQATGDYRSNAATFNWNTAASWQRWNGTTWVSNPTEGYPGQNASGIAGTVTIQSGHSVTANTDITTNDLGNLTLLGTAQLTFSSNTDIDVTNVLTLDGTSQISGTGTSRTLDAATLSIPATATDARVSTILLTISGGAVIAGIANFSSTTMTVNGNTTVTGSFTISSDTGTKTFKGGVTIANTGTWNSTAIATSGRLVFGGEVMSSGTFNPGCSY